MWRLKIADGGNDPTSSAPTTLWEDRYGSLILIMEPQKSELRLKQLVKFLEKSVWVKPSSDLL
ncbi:hypothetical protein CK203_057484 [Vitis vinifera]|uniref:Uncharacterized protein n=1 Tax=Vitis vinifera TaxID=29760 RepID=A0A438FT40_VITVI|nr:hypothetical protein CK203_057484 [Vitis vinifera]